MELLTPQEAGDRLKVTAKTIKRWATEGSIRSVTLPSGRIRIPTEVVDEMTAPAAVPADSEAAS